MMCPRPHQCSRGLLSPYGAFDTDLYPQRKYCHRAYAGFPDGSTYVMAGKAGQKAFYEAFGRQTPVASYPRPAPGTVVPDEVASMRSRKPKR